MTSVIFHWEGMFSPPIGDRIMLGVQQAFDMFFFALAMLQPTYVIKTKHEAPKIGDFLT